MSVIIAYVPNKSHHNVPYYGNGVPLQSLLDIDDNHTVQSIDASGSVDAFGSIDASGSVDVIVLPSNSIGYYCEDNNIGDRLFSREVTGDMYVITDPRPDRHGGESRRIL